MRLGDIADLQVGFAFKSNAYLTGSEGPRLVRGDNIGHGRLRWGEGTTFRWGDDLNDGRYQLREGDVVVGMDRPWIASGIKWARVRELDLPALLVQRVARIRAIDPQLQRFLGIAISSTDFADHVLAVQTGTSIPHVSGAQIAAFRLPKRTLAEMSSIASVLGALDDKIEANRSVTETCLQLVGAHFDAFEKSQDELTYGDVAGISGGGTPSTKVDANWGGDIAWATPTDVTGLAAPYLSRTGRSITATGLANCSSALHPVDSILMTSRATIGAFALAKTPTAVNQGFIVVNARRPEWIPWLLSEMQSRVGDYISNANGATFLELSRGRFKQMTVSWPKSESDLTRFGDRAQPLHARAYASVLESDNLARLRDALLPHLMSGRRTVREAEKRVEEVL